MESRKIGGIIAIIVGAIVILLNIILNYPLCWGVDICWFCVMTFWMVGIICIIVGLSLLFGKPKPKA